MVNFVSPGVYVIEKDLSDYTPAVNPTVVGIVGFATKGPTNKATLITSQENLIRTFGRPTEAIAGQGIEGALEILETANQTYYVRAVDDFTAAKAYGHVALGSCPAISVEVGPQDTHTDPDPEGGDPIITTGHQTWGTATATDTLYLSINGTINQAGTRIFSVDQIYEIAPNTDVGGGVVAQTVAEAVQAVIGGNLDADRIGAEDNKIYSSFAGEWCTLEVQAFVNNLDTPVTTLKTYSSQGELNAAAGANANAQGTTFISGDAAGSNGFCYLVESLWPGTGYNTDHLIDGSIVGNSVTVDAVGRQNVSLNVNENGVADETFKVSLLAGSFITDVINTGSLDPTPGSSEWISGNLYLNGNLHNTDIADQNTVFSAKLDATVGTEVTVLGRVENGTAFTVNPRFVKPVFGVTELAGGENGDGEGDPDAEVAALIGGEGTEGRTGMQALNDELAPITIALVPGISDQFVQNALITLATQTQSFLAVFGTPQGVGQPGDAIAYINGQTSLRSTAMNSSYAAIYYPHVRVFQPYLGVDLWMDPAIFAVRQMGYTDTVSELWFAPAGFVRGKLTKPVDTEVDINQGDRDSMYSGGNCLNPIVNFVQQGITIFGQRTTQREPTALDRINVRRLMIYIKRVITMSSQRFVFEPNDKITQERIEKLLVPLFEDVKRRRGITEFKVVCDETVNTPVRVDRNELWCKVLIKPTKAAEVIVFELNITNQSANIG